MSTFQGAIASCSTCRLSLLCPPPPPPPLRQRQWRATTSVTVDRRLCQICCASLRVPKEIVDSCRFFHCDHPPWRTFCWQYLLKIFVSSFLNFVMAQQNKGKSKTGNSAQQQAILQSFCIGLIDALLGCVRPNMPEAHFHCIAKILNNLEASTSVAALVHAIGLQHITVKVATNMGNLIGSDFGKQSLKVCLVPCLWSFPAVIFFVFAKASLKSIAILLFCAAIDQNHVPQF
jgi:hypothetical protein